MRNACRVPFLCLFLYLISVSVQAENSNQSGPELGPLQTFYTIENILESERPRLEYVDMTMIPKPEAFLLAQPLMTPGVAQYYKRTPKIRTPLQVDDNLIKNSYYRAVIMIIDNDANRDDALLADKKNESSIIELGLITINFPALPQEVIDGVRKGETPFGTLLVEHQIRTHSINTRYFEMPCDKNLSVYLNCIEQQTLYGRINTLVRNDNKKWVARVVEILAGAGRPV